MKKYTMKKALEENNQQPKEFSSRSKIFRTINTGKNAESHSLTTEDLMRLFANLMIDHILLDKQARLKLQTAVSNI